MYPAMPLNSSHAFERLGGNRDLEVRSAAFPPAGMAAMPFALVLDLEESRLNFAPDVGNDLVFRAHGYTLTVSLQERLPEPIVRFGFSRPFEARHRL